jgi:tetratricopeptide (TPR) repeat protein
MARSLVVVITLLIVAPQALRAEDAEPSLSQARDALWQGAPDRAAELAADVAGRTKDRDQGLARLLEAQALAAQGREGDAIEAWTKAATLLPDLGDRVALAQAEALLRDERFEEARSRFIKARKLAAIEPVAMYAELGEVEAALAIGGATAYRKGAQFLARYPDLPEKAEIELGMARTLEKRGQVPASIARYKTLFLEQPHTLAGVLARERLEVLARDGARVGRFGAPDHLERVRKLISARQFDTAEAELSALIDDAKGSIKLHLRLELAVVAFRRNELDRALGLLADIESQSGPTGPWIERAQVQSGDVSAAARRILQGKAPSRATPPGRLVALAELYLDAGMYAEARSALSLVPMHRAPGFFARWLPWISYKLGNYDEAIPGLSRMNEENWSRGRADYWVGRAHHQAGRPCEARSSYEAAIARDPHGYYALWARQRLGDLGDEVAAAHSTEEAEPLRCPAPTAEAPEATAEWTAPDLLSGWDLSPRRRVRPTEAEALAAFESLIASHGAPLPWLARARDLWLSGDDIGAGEELNQAWWVSRGYPGPKAGIASLWGGRPVVRRSGKRMVGRFSASQRALFAKICEAVGEPGLMLQAVRPAWGDQEGWHPLGYERYLREAAEQHGVQPELMWSIMRIESYFNRHAISHANAIGLMQILPWTGRRIARATDRRDFQVADLLHPTNGLDLSAWYLRGLSDRFHGQYPLMIAAYNGGPHNVASWIIRRADRDQPLPMDEFCEEIPFAESYRYVRRVTASLAVYHALAGMPPPQLPLFVNRDVTEGVNF